MDPALMVHCGCGLPQWWPGTQTDLRVASCSRAVPSCAMTGRNKHNTTLFMMKNHFVDYHINPFCLMKHVPRSTHHIHTSSMHSKGSRIAEDSIQWQLCIILVIVLKPWVWDFVIASFPGFTALEWKYVWCSHSRAGEPGNEASFTTQWS